MCDRETERQRECVSACVYEMKYIYMYMYIHCIYTMYFHNAPRVHDMYMYVPFSLCDSLPRHYVLQSDDRCPARLEDVWRHAQSCGGEVRAGHDGTSPSLCHSGTSQSICIYYHIPYSWKYLKGKIFVNVVKILNFMSMDMEAVH